MQKINAEDKCILGGCKRFAVVSTNKSLFEKKIMQFINSYNSPLGKLIMASDGESLTGLWFCGQKYCELYLDKEHEEKDLHIFDMTKKWLDMYFSGREPDFELPHKFVGSRFQNEVWEILCSIPYGKTVTYGDIAKRIACHRGIDSMSAQAVGSAVGRNRISIVVPCHRVIGVDGSMIGYAGGIDRKIELLKIEGVYNQT